MQHQSTAALVKAEQLSYCSVLLCKTGSQHDCSTAVTPMEICSSYMCALMQHLCTAALAKAEQLSHCSVLLCKTGSQQPCATAITPTEICSSYNCAVMQHLCTAALVKAEQLSHCSVLLCKNRLTAALCHCSYTYGDLLFIHVCTDATLMHCSTGQGRTAFSLFCAALQNRLTAACATAITPMEICSSYNCALMQHLCTAALVKAEQLSHCSVLLCKTGSQQLCATAVTPMEICSSYRCALMQH